MANVITKLNATNYQGEFEYQGAIGNFSADGKKQLFEISGNKVGLGSFDAHKNGDIWSYNPHFTDPTKAQALVSIMTGAIESIIAELAE